MKIILIGSGGHATSCLEVIKNSKRKINILGYVTKNKNKNKYFGKSLPLLGFDDDLDKIKNKSKCKNVLLAFGQIKSPEPRKKIYLKLKKKGFKFPIILSKYAIIAKDAIIDAGTIIMHKVIINGNVKIGKNCIINTGAIIEHDVIIKDNCHIATGAIINGGATIEEGSFVGSGSIIKQNIIIKKNSIIQAGAFIS